MADALACWYRKNPCASDEKGPNHALAERHLERNEPLALTLHDAGPPGMRTDRRCGIWITLLDTYLDRVRIGRLR